MSTLTPTQCAIVKAILAGNTHTKQLVRLLGVKPGTVRSHMNHIFDRVQVNDKAQLVLWAWRNGWTLDELEPEIGQIPDKLRRLADEMETVLR